MHSDAHQAPLDAAQVAVAENERWRRLHEGHSIDCEEHAHRRECVCAAFSEPRPARESDEAEVRMPQHEPLRACLVYDHERATYPLRAAAMEVLGIVDDGGFLVPDGGPASRLRAALRLAGRLP